MLISGLAVGAAGATGYGLWPKLGRYEEAVAQQRALLSANPALSDLVGMATLAANGHNTQPWRFYLDEQRVQILPDYSRRTAVVDPDDHHLFVSLGCAAENLKVAAAQHGFEPRLRFIDSHEPGLEISLDPDGMKTSPLYPAIPLRQSTRSVYDGAPISAEDLQRLKDAARQDGVSMLVFEERADLETILEAVIAGNSAQMDDPAFISELLSWLRFSPDQALKTGDGLFTASSGNPVLPSWIGERMFKAFFTKQSENDKYRDHVRSSSGIAIFIGDEQTPEHWTRVGQSFQRFALQATLLGIRTAHLNQAIEVPTVRTQFASWLGAGARRPDLVVRFGRASTLPMSLRRPVSDVIIQRA